MKRFQFEAIWPKFPGYPDTVAAGWQILMGNTDALQLLNQKFISSVCLQLVVTKEAGPCTVGAAHQHWAKDNEAVLVRGYLAQVPGLP
jgi:hypothetical protein